MDRDPGPCAIGHQAESLILIESLEEVNSLKLMMAF
jgi:hypothetical protein